MLAANLKDKGEYNIVANQSIILNSYIDKASAQLVCLERTCVENTEG